MSERRQAALLIGVVAVLVVAAVLLSIWALWPVITQDAPPTI